VSTIVGEHDLLRRCLRARDFNDDRRTAQAALDFRQKLAGSHAEGAGKAAAAAGDITDQFLPFRTNRTEQHGLRIAFKDLGDVGEVDRLRTRLELIGTEAVDEAAQPEAIDIGRLVGRRRAGFLDHAHRALRAEL
jgi:hypothetical protein